MTTRAQLIAEALTWERTPFHHQAALKGIGADCIGLVRGSLAALGIEARGIPQNYGRGPDPLVLLAAVDASDQLGEIAPAAAQPGDLLLFRVKRDPRHFGLLVAPDRLLHADLSHGVVVVPYTEAWQKRAVRAWRLVDLEDA